MVIACSAVFQTITRHISLRILMKAKTGCWRYIHNSLCWIHQSLLAGITVNKYHYYLQQQTGRYLVKLLTETLRDPTSTGHLSPTTIYLHSLTKRELFIAQRCAARTVHDLLDPEIQLLILSHRAGSLVSELSEQWAKNPGASWSLLNIDSAR